MTQLPEWANWLARDEDGSLYAFSHKPEKSTIVWVLVDGEYELIKETDNRYAHIKWEDNEPTSVAVALHTQDEPPIFESTDMVNHPNHYKQGGLETIDIMQALLPHEQFIGYLKGNIIKYRERAEHKGNAEQDYAKAKWYYDKLMEVQHE